MERLELSGVSIASIYYAHGLKCSKYPAHFIIFVGVVTIVCSLPFFITTSGGLNSPRPWRTPWLNYRLPTVTTAIGNERGGDGGRGNGPASDWIVNDPSLMSFRTPIWFLGLPLVIIQQVYVDVQLDCDSFSELCPNMQHLSLSKKTMALMMESLMTAERSCAPVMHPAFSKFARVHSNKDTPLPSFISSILSPLNDNFQLLDKSPNSMDNGIQANLSVHTIKELFYGGFWEVSHAHSINERNSNLKEQRFALTFALEPSIDNFDQITKCVQTLNNIWPIEDTSDLQFMKHVYYESEWTLTSFAPLICLYSIVFLYISFSVGKIDLVRSKLGLGFTAVITVLCSLTMSLGICTFFGLSITVSGSEIFPFVVVVIGLENILIITKAVISTDPGLEIKYRIAEGLGKEGRALTKNLLTVLGLVILGVFTFNYAMKEFCIIALVGLLCDYFLHITFFTTVLSIDLRRMELTELSFHSKPSQGLQSVEPKWRMSKRDRVNSFLVRNRFAQRFFAVVLFVYFMSVISHTERFHNFVSTVATPTQHHTLYPPSESASIENPIPIPHEVSMNENSTVRKKRIKEYIEGVLGPELESKESRVSFRSDEDGFSIPCMEESYCWIPMVDTHWPRLLHYYNLTLEKRFMTVLPPIMLNHRLGFSAQKLFARTTNTKDLYVTLSHITNTLLSIPNMARWIVLQIGGGIVIAYLLILSREASHIKKKEDQEKETQKLTTVSKLKGHVQDIECLSIDDGYTVTASLDGMVYVWDMSKRECSIVIDRRELRLRDYRDSISRHVEGCESSDIKSSTPPTPSSTSLSSSGKFTKSLPPHQSPPSLPHQPIPPLTPTLPSPASLPASTSTPTTIFQVHLPQKIIPGFLKRLSMPTIGTILKRSPEKPDKTINEEGDVNHGLTDLSTKRNISDIPAHVQSAQSPVPSARRPLQHSFSAPSNNSRSSSMGSLNSTKAVTTYNRPLVSHSEQLSSSSKKSLHSHSMDSSTASMVNSPENWSAESISLEDNSDLSYGTPETGPSPPPPATSSNGFQFTRHFSVYSQFTSELAMMQCPDAVDELWDTFAPSPVWCLDLSKGTVIVGCGNGQIEAWNSTSGSLKFCLALNLPGVTTIKGHPIGIISGHLDGSLQLTSHHGQLVHGVQAHRGPVTALCCSDDTVISGGYDSINKIYRISDFLLLRSLKLHKGSIVTLSFIENDKCFSACSFGIICIWNYKTGQIVQQLDSRCCTNSYRGTMDTSDGSSDEDELVHGVAKACCNNSYIIALTRDSRVLIWSRNDGYLSNIVELGRYASDITLISPHHFAIALQSQIIVYDISSRREATRKDLDSQGMPIIRHLTSLESSKLICTTGRDLQMIPTGLKIKTE